MSQSIITDQGKEPTYQLINQTYSLLSPTKAQACLSTNQPYLQSIITDQGNELTYQLINQTNSLLSPTKATSLPIN